MNRTEFLEDLREALEKAKVENVEEIIDIYEKRFLLGFEAEMTDEEIIDMLGDIDDIVRQYTKEKTDDEDNDFYQMKLELHLFSDFSISRSKEQGIRVRLDDSALEYVEVIKEGRKFTLKNKQIGNFTKRMAKFEGELFIGPEVKFNQFVISTISTDLEVCAFSCNTLAISNVSGDLNFDGITCKEKVSIHNTTGDIQIDRISSPLLTLGTVSGDINIEDLTCDEVVLSTVSGDVEIYRSNEADYKISSVSGDVTLHHGVDINRVKASSISGCVEVSGNSIGSDISSKIKESLSKIKF